MKEFGLILFVFTIGLQVLKASLPRCDSSIA
jgi:uncharacterized transporter YbjL